MKLFSGLLSTIAHRLGFRSYSCIDAVHNRAMRFYLGVGKYTPNDAVAGEMGWQPPSVR